jgi:hypothetical protein
MGRTGKSRNSGMDATKTPGGFAVIELFTSEGCSSCPPADELVARILNENADQPIYILAYHVDYWDNLGWKDHFSNTAYSKRQNQYADWLKLQTIYTPQVIVNGRTEFVGSDESKLRGAVKEDLGKSQVARLSLNNIQLNKGKTNFQYQIEKAPENVSLVIAIVQKSAKTRVERGENKGRLLSHVQIVRELQIISVDGKDTGNAQITMPENPEHQEIELIGFLQNEKTGEIIAAARRPLNNT